MSPLQRGPDPRPADASRTRAKRPTLADRLVVAATVAIFVAAAVVLFDQFRDITPKAVLAVLAAMPRARIAAAIALTAASYLLLTGYDVLALRYVGQRLRWRDIVFTSFTAFAFSNTLGFQLLSGGSMRYRIYSTLGLQGGTILEIVAFCTLTYALGVVTVGGMVFVSEPRQVASLLAVPPAFVVTAGAAMLAAIAAYLAAALQWHGRRLGFGRFQMRVPTLSLAVAQVALASVDALLAGTVFYVLLPADIRLGYAAYIGIYMIAATTSVISLVPGGLGVFETAITLMTTPPSKAAALGAFLAYRLIYFLAPFIVAVACFMVHETGRFIGKGDGGADSGDRPAQ